MDTVTAPIGPGPGHLDVYDHTTVEARWRRIWDERGDYRTELDEPAHPFYNLMMFPYPSAEGLHVGHIIPFAGGDIYGRWRRLMGDTVFEPMGFDAFGIHSENYAMKIGEHPAVVMRRAVANFRENQLARIGSMFDWGHQVNTAEPSYYRWNSVAVRPTLQRRAHRVARRGGQLVSVVPHRARRRAGGAGSLRALPHAGADTISPPVVDQDHPLRAGIAQCARHARLVGVDENHAAQLDRAERGGNHPVRSRRMPAQGHQRVHHASRHALRRHLPGDRRRPPRARGLRGPGAHGGGQRVAQQIPAGRRRTRLLDRIRARFARHPSADRSASSGLGRSVRARRVRHRSDHGRPRARRTRLGLRACALAADRRGHQWRQCRRGRIQRRGHDGQQRRVHRRDIRRWQAAHHRAPGRAASRATQRAVQDARLADLTPAVLGPADSDHPLSQGRPGRGPGGGSPGPASRCRGFPAAGHGSLAACDRGGVGQRPVPKVR